MRMVICKLQFQLRARAHFAEALGILLDNIKILSSLKVIFLEQM